ncbi:hypothetical protein SSX86_010570 [Deinandra increscens subsp. villosa]|uniref:Protein kinase domain-containing protein n=1 Tax=Deinandra increscens subsp. villosa TaxID=3103831 RepID=A0AAP0H520_9ASTR
MEKWEHLRIPFADIEHATNSFQKEIGRGGYGSVYEGELVFKGKLTKIAVKKLRGEYGQGLKEFLTEIDLLSGQQHENIITLLGFCDEGNEKIIVYEHAEHGSLDRLCTIRGNDGILLLADVAKEHYKENKLDMVIDPSLRKQMSHEVLSRYSAIAYKCLLGRKDRPPMDDVKKELEEMLKLETRNEEVRRIQNVWRSCEENIVSDEYLKKLTIFSLDVIKLATFGFAVENFIGEGAFGKVYSGNISGSKVAIKHIHKKGDQLYMRYLKETSFLSTCDNVNIISLVGYCDEGDERILVYEYMSNGSLYDYLFRFDRFQDKTPHIMLEQHLEICIGVAKGLSYLHSGTHFSITHGDISLKNILLDRNMVPKISNFKSAHAHLIGSSVSQVIANTIKGRELRQKADVHAFGRVLSKVLWVGIPPNAEDQHRYIKTAISLECLHECENLIWRCLEIEPDQRPVMSEVVERLELALKLQMGQYILIPPSQLKFVYKRFMTDFF